MPMYKCCVTNAYMHDHETLLLIIIHSTSIVTGVNVMIYHINNVHVINIIVISK